MVNDRTHKRREYQTRYHSQWRRTIGYRWSLRARRTNTRAKKWGLPGRIRSRDLAKIGRQCGHPECTRTLDVTQKSAWDDFHVDHIVPFENGGSNTLVNVWLLCAEHHAEKNSHESFIRANPSQAFDLWWLPTALVIQTTLDVARGTQDEGELCEMDREYIANILTYLREAKPLTPSLDQIVEAIPRHPDVMVTEHPEMVRSILEGMVDREELRRYKGQVSGLYHYCLRYDRGEPGTRSVSYHEYLQSPQWLTTRRMAMEKAGGRCQICNGQEDLEVHHRTYQDRGNERLEDLTVLCGPCHGRFHTGVVR